MKTEVISTEEILRSIDDYNKGMPMGPAGGVSSQEGRQRAPEAGEPTALASGVSSMEGRHSAPERGGDSNTAGLTTTAGRTTTAGGPATTVIAFLFLFLMIIS